MTLPYRMEGIFCCNSTDISPLRDEGKLDIKQKKYPGGISYLQKNGKQKMIIPLGMNYWYPRCPNPSSKYWAEKTNNKLYQ